MKFRLYAEYNFDAANMEEAALKLAGHFLNPKNGGGQLLLERLIENWSADPKLTIGVPFRSMASDVLNILPLIEGKGYCNLTFDDS